MTISTQMPVLQVENLTIDYRIDSRWQKAINEFEITLHPGQIYGIVGESGSGKSTVIQGIMHYLSKNGRISAGSVLLNDENLVPKKRRQMRHLWGSQMHMVPQNPFTALNPSIRVGEQIAELIRLHKADNGHSTNEQVYDLLTMVRLADPSQIAQRYPHELSGGQQQRVVLAMAVATSPQILLLDEPTTSLDVTTEATILDLIRDLVNRTDAGAIFVTHNLGVVAQMCERVTVMYGGEIMEDAAVADLYLTPLHPYTIGLLACIPKFGDSKYNRALRTIPGSPPSITGRSHACVFSDRCPVAKEICFTEKPPLDILKDNRKVRCHRWQEIAAGELVVAQAYEEGIEIRVEDEDETILKVEGITKHFDVPLDVMDIFDKLRGKAVFNKLQAVDNVNLSIQRGHTLGLVGESGSGKSTLARVIMGLTDRTSGNIDLLGIDIRNTVEARRLITLSHLQMIFQNPEDSLNPYMRVGDAIARPLITLNRRNPIRDWMDSTTPSPFLRYGGMTILRTLNFFIGLALLIVDMVGVGNQAAKERTKELLKDVNLDESYMNRFPNQLSGGEKQRVAIARAFASSPELIICDEPVSSLDVSVQAAVLNLLAKLQQENDTAYLFISHDLAVVGYLADYLAVMYLGEIFEVGYGSDLFAPPYHPYTEALLSAIPVPDPTHQSNQIRLSEDIPSPQHLPSGCRFHTRCPRKIGAICEAEIPPWRDDGNGHYIRCHIPIEELTELQAVPNNDHEEG